MIDKNPWEAKDTALLPSSGAAPSRKPRSIAYDINLQRVLQVWPLSLVVGALFLFAAMTWVRYQVPIYSASIRISTKDDPSASLAVPGQNFVARDPLNDKLELLRSQQIGLIVAKKLNLQHSAKLKGQFRDKDLYGSLNWQAWNGQQEPGGFTMLITQPDQQNGFTWTIANASGKAKWNEPFTSPAGDTIALFSSAQFKPDAEIVCTRTRAESAAARLSSGISPSANTQNYTITITYNDEVAVRGRQILTELVGAYDVVNVEYKNRSLVKSLDFIQSRLAPIAGELDSIESAIASYRSTRAVATSVADPGNAQALADQKRQMELQRRVISTVENFINDPNTPDENLSLVGINDGYLQGLMGQYQTLRMEREKISRSATEQNPNRRRVEDQLQSVRNNLDVQIKNYKEILAMQEQQIKSSLGEARSLIASAPMEDKQMLDKNRQQNIKQSLYVQLLQRREEIALALASTTSDTRVLSPAGASGPISPKPMQLYVLAVAIGLLLPIGVTAARELLNGTITSKKQLQDMVTAPLIGTIDLTQAREERLYIMGKGDRSAAAEQIRSLRANIDFYTKGKETLYILLTSSYSGEGKSFLSGNLAKGYALQGLRVALLEFDMRKPKLARRMGFNQKEGLSGVLIGRYQPSEVFLTDPEQDNLHLYPTGAVPPNPSELLSAPSMADLKKYLDTHYDVVVIDTPPLGIVSDAQLLAPWAHISLVVVRFGVTPRQQVLEVEEWHQKGLLGHMGIVLNGVKTTGYYGGYSFSPYSYKHQYAYASDYYSDGGSKKPGFIKRMFGKKK